MMILFEQKEKITKRFHGALKIQDTQHTQIKGFFYVRLAVDKPKNIEQHTVKVSVVSSGGVFCFVRFSTFFENSIKMFVRSLCLIIGLSLTSSVMSYCPAYEELASSRYVFVLNFRVSFDFDVLRRSKT